MQPFYRHVSVLLKMGHVSLFFLTPVPFLLWMLFASSMIWFWNSTKGHLFLFAFVSCMYFAAPFFMFSHKTKVVKCESRGNMVGGLFLRLRLVYMQYPGKLKKKTKIQIQIHKNRHSMMRECSERTPLMHEVVKPEQPKCQMHDEILQMSPEYTPVVGIRRRMQRQQ